MDAGLMGRWWSVLVLVALKSTPLKGLHSVLAPGKWVLKWMWPNLFLF